MKNRLKKVIILVFLLAFSLPLIKMAKLNASTIKADIMNLEFTEGQVIDNSDYQWDVLLSQQPTFEKVSLVHNGISYETTAFVKDYINEGVTVNWTSQNNDEFNNKFKDGFSMTIAVQITEFLETSQDRILMGNAASGGMDILLNSENKFCFEIHNGGGYTVLKASEPAVTGELYYITAVYNATDAMVYLYINDNLAASQACPGFRQSTKFGMSVGGVCDAANPTGIAYSAYRADNGYYVKAAMYDKDLTLEEVKNEYNEFLNSMKAIEKNPDLLDFDIQADAVIDNGSYQFETILTGTYQTAKAIFVNNMRTYELMGYQKTDLSQGITINYTSEDEKPEFIDKITDGFTMSTAFIITNFAEGDRVIFGNAASGGADIFLSSDNTIKFEMHNGSGYTIVSGTEPIELNQLYHVTATFDASKQLVSLYINGTLVGTDTASSFRLSTKRGISLGGICDAANPTGISTSDYRADLGYYFIGKWYSDVLTETEATSAYRTFMKKTNEITSEKVTRTIDAIAGIGDVTEESGEKIQNAREHYDNLNDYEKTLVNNYSVLLEAEYLYRIFSRTDATFNEDNITTKIGVVSDTHVGYPDMDKSYERALTILERMSGGLDAIINAGDMTQDGLANQAKLYVDTTKKVIDLETTPIISCYGNHDTYWSGCMSTQEFMTALGNDYFKFDENLSESAEGNRHIIVNGYHFLTVQTQTYMPGNNVFSDATKMWLDNTINTIVTANPNAPVFVVGHSPVLNTIYGSYESDPTGVWGANEQLGHIFEKYPQVMYLSGHTHYSVNDERAVMQDKFTSILVGSTGDIELESGRIEGTALGNRRTYSSGLLMEIDNLGNTRITRIDFAQDKVIKNTWIIPAPDQDNIHLTYYTKYRATQNNDAPAFSSNASIIAEKTGSDSVRVTFSVANDDDMVYDYQITIKDGENNVIGTAKSLSHFWDYPNLQEMPDTKSVEMTGIDLKKPYTIEIVAFDSWENASAPLILSVEDTSVQDKAAAQVVIDSINELGTITADSLDSINATIEKYNSLNFEQKTYVENYDVLLSAIYEIQQLYLTENEINNPIDITYMAPGAVGITNKTTGVDIAWNNGSYNSSIGLAKKVNLTDFYLTLENVKSASDHFDLGLLFNDNMNGTYADGTSMLLWFNFIKGTMHLYPDAGGTKILESELLKTSQLGSSRIDIHIYKVDAGYAIDVTTFQGVVSGILPKEKVALVTQLNNPESCYLSFSPWASGANYSLTVRAMGDTPNDHNYHLVSSYKLVPMIKKNINNLPAEVTLDNEIVVNMIDENYQLLDEYLKSLISEEETTKLQNAIQKIKELKEQQGNPDPITPKPEPEPDEGKPSDNTNNGCSCNSSAVLLLCSFVIIASAIAMIRRKQ